VDEDLDMKGVRVGGAVDLEGFQGGGNLLIEACILGGLPSKPGLSLKRAEIAGEVRIKELGYSERLRCREAPRA
jgi:hypothetical protein